MRNYEIIESHEGEKAASIPSLIHSRIGFGALSESYVLTTFVALLLDPLERPKNAASQSILWSPTERAKFLWGNMVCFRGLGRKDSSTYITCPSHRPTLLPWRWSTNHELCISPVTSFPISHIRSRRHATTSSTRSCESWKIVAMGNVACGRWAISVDGELNVNRIVRLGWMI